MIPGWGGPVELVTKTSHINVAFSIIPAVSVTYLGYVIYVGLEKDGLHPSTLLEYLGIFLLIVYILSAIITTIASPLPIYILSLFYRLSVKSTFYIWLPIIYLVKDVFDNKISLQANLAIIRTSSLSRIIRLSSWLTLLIFSFKIFIIPDIIAWWNSLAFAQVANIYLTPNEVCLWQIISALNAILNLVCFYYFFDTAHILLKESLLSEAVVIKRFQIFKLVRGIQSIYTISAMLLLTLNSAQHLNLPKVSFRLWPQLQW